MGSKAQIKYTVEAGQRYGHLVIEKPDLPLLQLDGRVLRGCLARCDCQTVAAVLIQDLHTGSVSSCGCRGDAEAAEARKLAWRAAEAALDGTGFSVEYVRLKRKGA